MSEATLSRLAGREIAERLLLAKLRHAPHGAERPLSARSDIRDRRLEWPILTLNGPTLSIPGHRGQGSGACDMVV